MVLSHEEERHRAGCALSTGLHFRLWRSFVKERRRHPGPHGSAAGGSHEEERLRGGLLV